MTTIVHAADYSPEYPGNFIASLTRLRSACAARGWDTVAVFPETTRQRAWCAGLAGDGWRLRFVPHDASLLDRTRMLAAIVREHRARLIHTHFSAYDLPAWAAAKLVLGRAMPTEVVWHLHSELDHSTDLPRRAKNFVKYRHMSRSAWVIPVGDSVTRGVLAAGCPPDRVVAVPNGIDLARATAATRPRSQVLADLGLGDDTRLVLLFGIEPYNKGVDLALRAMDGNAATLPQVALAIVGRQKLRTYLAETLGAELPSWVRVIAPVQNVADLYAAAEVFLSASRSEGFPYSVAEAMANGLPVVVSDIPGVAWARRSPGALFFARGDSDALAAALRQALGWSAAQRAERAADNRALATAECDVSAWATRMLRFYEGLLEPPGSGLAQDYSR
jgi:glycosyltransferase involved in cell wall biosynthesis